MYIMFSSICLIIAHVPSIYTNGFNMNISDQQVLWKYFETFCGLFLIFPKLVYVMRRSGGNVWQRNLWRLSWTKSRKIPSNKKRNLIFPSLISLIHLQNALTDKKKIKINVQVRSQKWFGSMKLFSSFQFDGQWSCAFCLSHSFAFNSSGFMEIWSV